ncbi:hypothetical protein [Bradyrhizobium sp.]|uniref:hypothetical protein n=1 Tax=Bradyrhizobium sp. TaxID=376 RepID=UPI003C46096B
MQRKRSRRFRVGQMISTGSMVPLRIAGIVSFGFYFLHLVSKRLFHNLSLESRYGQPG